MLPCAVLAGGLGTRMRPLIDSTPKSLIPVLARPFAEVQPEWLARAGVRDIFCSIGFKGDLIRAALERGTALE
jgi:NDP-sugar pyrophosphorylase family protein